MTDSTLANTLTSNTPAPIIAAYYPEWAIYSRDFNVADVPAENLTHLIYAFSKIDSSGRMGLFDTYAAVEKTFNAADSVDGVADTWDQTLAGNFNQLAELKLANPELKTMIAVGGWTLSGTFSDVAATVESRVTFAKSVADFMQKYPMFDGIDFDWEYAGGGGLESNIVRAEDGDNYALLLKEVRAELDNLEAQTGHHYQISVASPAGADKIAQLDLEQMAPSVDFFNLMAYDYHGGWETTTGHQAPMFDTIGGNYDISTAVDLYLSAGVDPTAIVLGTPAYTRAWSGVEDGGDGGWNAASTGLAQGTFERGVYDYKDIVTKITAPNSDWKIYWDDNAQAAYAYSPSEKIYTTLETPASVALKAQWAQSKGLGGMMLWDLSGDITSGAESLSGAAYQSWYEGVTFEAIAGASVLSPDVVVAGNGEMDTIADYVYVPPTPVPTPSLTPDSSPTDAAGATNNGGTSITDSIVPTVTAPAQVITINWSWGSNQQLSFNPATDLIDLGWFQAREFTLTEVNGSTVLSILSNQQSYTLKGVTLSSLQNSNFVALDSGTITYVSSVIGTHATPTPVVPYPVVPEPTPVIPPVVDPTPSPIPVTGGTTTSVGWAWGSHKVIDFNPASDTLDFGWNFQSGQLTISETNGSTVISIPSNAQSYTLTGVTLSELTTANFVSNDSGLITYVAGVLGSISAVPTPVTAPVVPDSGTTNDNVPPHTTSISNVWVSGQVYTAGDRVRFGDKVYEAKWWTQSDTPTNGSTTADVWKLISDTSDTNDTPVTPFVPRDPLNSADQVFSPYIDMSLSKSQNLSQIVHESGISDLTLAFMLNSGTDQVGWGGIGTIQNDALPTGSSMHDQITAIQQEGVNVRISFGGAMGSEPALQFSSADALTHAYQDVMDRYNVNYLDFDIEGGAMANSGANHMRDEALVALQLHNPDLHVSFTLPAMPTGLTYEGINLITQAKQDGVKIDTVNIMAMDYGAYADSGDMGQDAIDAALATIGQLRDLGIDAKVGITPMIGINDVQSEVFTVEDANQLMAFAKDNPDIASIGMWSLGRDNASQLNVVSPVASGISQTEYEFSGVFGVL